jgi:hypothetical protein
LTSNLNSLPPFSLAKNISNREANGGATRAPKPKANG